MTKPKVRIELKRGLLLYHLVIRAGNNKTTFHTENFFSKSNAKEAGKRAEKDFGIPYVGEK